MQTRGTVGAPGAAPRTPTVLPLVAIVAGISLLREPIAALFTGPVARTWVTIVLSVTVQALPFLVLGVLVSSAIVAFVPSSGVARVFARRPVLGVPIAGVAGMALPGCECGSVVVAGRMVAAGVPPGPAIAFLLAAPSVNPVVLVATAVAFPGQPKVVLARFVASFATAVIVGLAWGRIVQSEVTACLRPPPHAPPGRWIRFRSALIEDVLHAGGFLVLGAMATGTLQVALRPDALGALGASGALGVPVLAAMAVLLCVCSEADAFVAGGLTQFSFTARLAFMVVGPVVDLKLIALHAAMFGRRFVVRFEPVVLCTAVAASIAVGACLR
jgi:uncharacterized membrane protein YraQ (UPF0718 family)